MEAFGKQVLDFLPTLGIALLILAAGILLTFAVTRIAQKAFGKSKLDPSLTAFFVRTIRVTCYVMIAIAFLSKLGVSTTGLIAFFSAGLAAVALALKDNISDIASGIVILFTRPFVTGDFIEFGSFKGYVKKIDLIHTKILTYDDTEVIVPNSKITTSEVNNYSSSPDIRVVIYVPISYAADIDKTKEVLFNAACSVDKTLKDEKHTPQIRLQTYGESSLDFQVRVWCDFKDYWPVYYQLTEGIKKSLDANGIPIPFNQLDVHIIDKK
jgi:small conductance mechanosensitive channel